MARIKSTVGLFKALALVSWRDLRSIGSISGQNLFLFVAFVAYQQAESAAFFGLLFAAVLVFPLSTDPLQKIPVERRLTWPLHASQWSALRIASLLLSPFTWIAVILCIRMGWQVAGQVFAFGLSLTILKYLATFFSKKIAPQWHFRIPAPPGVIGALMRLHWREMFHTLDPYVAASLMLATTLYRIFGKPLDPVAPRIMSLVVALAISTQAQVLLGLDGRGAERYRQIPLKGWRILLAKDLAFLTLLALLVAPLHLLAGVFGGLASLTIGHHRSVLQPIPQTRWRFTSGAIFPDGLAQTVALFSVGSTVHAKSFPFMAACVAAWVLSLIYFGRRWDRQA